MKERQLEIFIMLWTSIALTVLAAASVIGLQGQVDKISELRIEARFYKAQASFYTAMMWGTNAEADEAWKLVELAYQDFKRLGKPKLFRL